jgi:hypothetical protein
MAPTTTRRSATLAASPRRAVTRPSALVRASACPWRVVVGAAGTPVAARWTRAGSPLAPMPVGSLAASQRAACAVLAAPSPSPHACEPVGALVWPVAARTVPAGTGARSRRARVTAARMAADSGTLAPSPRALAPSRPAGVRFEHACPGRPDFDRVCPGLSAGTSSAGRPALERLEIGRRPAHRFAARSRRV